MIPCCKGKILWVDLTTGKCKTNTITDEIYENFLSGSGLAAWLSWQHIPPGCDPLGQDNLLGFVSGLLSGSGSLFSGRWIVTAKSPLTKTWSEANCGGSFSTAIKRCGYDGIFFSGRSPEPVYLLIENEEISLQNAADLWGKGTHRTERLLKNKHHQNSQVACIGTAGEKLSLISGISHDGGRMAARGGLGAVMGSKNLKALVLRGREDITSHNPAEMRNLSRQIYQWVKLRVPFPNGAASKYLGTLIRIAPLWMSMDGLLYKTILRRWGTIGMNQISLEMGDAPVQNWSKSSADFGFKHSNAFNPDRITAFQEQRYSCSACPLGCGGWLNTTQDGEAEHKIEYETITAWGSLLMNKDLNSIFKINKMLNEAGMDSISAGATVAFAIECFQNGLLSLQDTGGLQLDWGNTEAILDLLQMMIAREGIGDLLADGCVKAAEKIDVNALDFAMQCGGQELAMHDCRSDPAFALHASAEPVPGRHTSGSHLYYDLFSLWKKIPNIPQHKRFILKKHKFDRPKETAAAAAASSQFTQVLNGAGLCLFGAFFGVQRIPIFEWLNEATGWQKTPQEYMRIGARIKTLKHLFNLREGLPTKHAINQRALGNPPQSNGANKERTIDLDELLELYWRNGGYDAQNGLPEDELLRELGLETFPYQ